MANVLLHTLLFPPDGNSNAYIFADIALELQKYGHKVTVLTTTPHYGVVQENLDRQPFSEGKHNWYKRSSFHDIDCYHIVVPPEKGSIKQRLITYLKFHFRAFMLSGYEDIKADIVISQSPPLSIGILNTLIANRKRAKSVYVVQDLFPDGLITQEKIKNPILIRLLRFVEKMVYSHNDAIIAVSEGIRLNLSKRVPEKILLKTIPNFVDTDIYHPMPKNNQLALKYQTGNHFIISYVGNIGNAHDLSPILYCARQLRDLDIKFIIAGNGIRKGYYENETIAAGLDNVQFIGYQKREVTPMINAFSDICLVLLAPHVRDFSFPSKIYTLMAMAKPIILMCSPECDAAEFINVTKTGWVLESGQREQFTALIKELYNNRQLLNQFGDNSLDQVVKFTKISVGRQYDQLIRELCS